MVDRRTRWNEEKIRERCLELLGWSRCKAPLGCAVSAHVHDPDGHVVETDEPASQTWYPNPVTSLDDALPLMEKYKVSLSPLTGTEIGLWEASGDARSGFADAESPSLAVCLFVLRCLGHNTEEFQIVEVVP